MTDSLDWVANANLIVGPMLSTGTLLYNAPIAGNTGQAFIAAPAAGKHWRIYSVRLSIFLNSFYNGDGGVVGQLGVVGNSSFMPLRVDHDHPVDFQPYPQGSDCPFGSAVTVGFTAEWATAVVLLSATYSLIG